jgi:hypothetical protein
MKPITSIDESRNPNSFFILNLLFYRIYRSIQPNGPTQLISTEWAAPPPFVSLYDCSSCPDDAHYGVVEDAFEAEYTSDRLLGIPIE